MNTLAIITERKAGFRSLTDTWADTTTLHGRLMLTVLGGLAEFERDLIRARTGEGRARAVARGVKMGRPPKLTPHQRKEAIKRRDEGNETLADIPQLQRQRGDDFTSRMKWNEWNLIVFGLVMGGIVGATVTGLIGTPAIKLLLGNDGRLQWETLVAGLVAVGVAVATITKLNDQIRQTGKLADDQRRRRARAARAVLPLALLELANYSTVCVKQLYGLRQYFQADGSLNQSRSDEASSTWTSPHLSENVLAVLKECIEFIDDDPAIAASELIRHLQIQQTRLRDDISRLRLVDGIHIITWNNIDQAMRDAAEIYARAMPLFVSARGQSVMDLLRLTLNKSPISVG